MRTCSSTKRANRMKVLVHDGFGLWLCARRLYEGSFIRAGARHDRGMALSHEQLQAIVVGLPWERLDERNKIPNFVRKKSPVSMCVLQQIWQYQIYGDAAQTCAIKRKRTA